MSILVTYNFDHTNHFLIQHLYELEYLITIGSFVDPVQYLGSNTVQISIMRKLLVFMIFLIITRFIISRLIIKRLSFRIFWNSLFSI